MSDTINSLRRLTTAGAVGAVVLLVGAASLALLSFLLSLSRFTPYGLWSVLALVVVAALAGAIAWRGGIRGGTRARRATALPVDVLVRAPPPIPLRNGVHRSESGPAGRLGLETTVNRLVEERRYDDALRRLTEIETADPAMATFCAVKRRAIARRRTRGR